MVLNMTKNAAENIESKDAKRPCFQGFSAHATSRKGGGSCLWAKETEDPGLAPREFANKKP
jgi:hypothetical protein